MYDFIIFEHSGIRNHFIDLYNIGIMLKDCGLKVAIANVTNEAVECINDKIPIIYTKTDPTKYKNKNSYMKAVINELSPMTKNFYVGSILSSTSLRWLKYIPNHQKVFLWALRSFFFTSYKRIRISRSYPANIIRSLYNTWITRTHKNIYFFISNAIIRDEFIELGYKKNRMIIRPERTTSIYNFIKKEHNNPLNLLSIGTLRKEKRIDLCINALEAINDPEIHYTIAGKAYSTNNYDKNIEKQIKNNPFITRISNRLSSEEYKTLINKCDYLILCDEKQPSCVTNGTMAEALLSGIPIIAPNYTPYTNIIKNYKVGFLYDLHNKESLINVLKLAKITKPTIFADGIIQYQKDYMYDNILSVFKSELLQIIK